MTLTAYRAAQHSLLTAYPLPVKAVYNTSTCRMQGANILVTDEGVCKLADFGASKFVEDLASVGGNTVAGTPFWMAPEIVKQVRGSGWQWQAPRAQGVGRCD